MPSAPNTSKFVAIVTGANQGIGKAIVAQLAHRPTSSLIYLAARDEKRGNEAVDELKNGLPADTSIAFLHLDVTNEASINAAAARVKSEAGIVNVLINNAGVAAKGSAFDGEIAKWTVTTNYTGTRKTTQAFLPLIPENGRIVNVSSTMGRLGQVSKELQDQFSSKSLTLDGLDKLMDQFVASVADGTYASKGWPQQAYGVSKVGVTAFSRVLARQPEITSKNILVAACCPGWVRTNMGGEAAHLSVEDGAKTPVWLATADKQEILEGGKLENGLFYRDRKHVEW
ncbi:inducible carbonyl reductase [Fimicolochytrium jonesii]|uniref:inducible carbonyl reductase n=1 Tax=Fimicolochytrium jonesii TaxID=1396493 RepID=UPI0022FE8B7C|nr:inducible carbonyl reductase [Fimicolochytrium jonesii]KAI8821811.1 inducible carbonyl reductase [Fimicolochytrium jonesii]